MMSRVLGVLIPSLALSACFKDDITHCPTVDCPGGMVCDGLGGCATPEQMSRCAGQTDGAECSYTTVTNAHVDGACEQGVCRSTQIPACLADLFTDSRVDTGMWELWLPENAPVVVAEAAGQLGIELAPNVGRVYN